MQTEKATDRWDLPHEFAQADPFDHHCRCGRVLSNRLHERVLGEQAALFEAPTQTEKGS